MEIDNVTLKKEWLQHSRAANPNNRRDLEFNKGWKEVLPVEDPQTGVRFPYLCTLVNIICSLPNLNAVSERTLSSFPDISIKQK